MNSNIDLENLSYEIINLSSEKVGVYQDVSINLGNKLLENLKNSKMAIWEENRENNGNFLVKNVGKEVEFIVRKLMLDFVDLERVFEEEKEYSIPQYTGFQIIKNLPSDNVPNYEKKSISGEDSYFLIYYLNNEYEGGELFLPKTNNFIVPKSNQLIIFSNEKTEYNVNPITSGVQYVLTMFAKIRD
jgi:hypothetical protein